MSCVTGWRSACRPSGSEVSVRNQTRETHLRVRNADLDGLGAAGKRNLEVELAVSHGAEGMGHDLRDESPPLPGHGCACWGRQSLAPM